MFYLLVDDKKLAAMKEELSISCSRKLNKIAFHHCGKIVIKENMRNCDKCNAENFHLCNIEEGKISHNRGSDNNDDDDDDFSYYGDKDNQELEENEVPKETYFDVAEDGAFVAVFSQSIVNELFYNLKVIGKGVATDNITDDNNQTARKGEWYVVIGFY